jgi:hypothetical protein
VFERTGRRARKEEVLGQRTRKEPFTVHLFELDLQAITNGTRALPIGKVWPTVSTRRLTANID